MPALRGIEPLRTGGTSPTVLMISGLEGGRAEYL